MFWECHVVTSSIDKLLDQPADQTRLQDFLDESDLIQECLNQNQRLLDHLVQPTTMKELIQQVIALPETNDFHNANVVSELLSGDFQRIQESLLTKEHLDILYSFLLTDKSTTLNPILASYFARILITLIIRKPVELIDYLRSRSTFKEDFISRLDSTSIGDILYRLIADSADQRSSTIQWYEEINLIDDLMKEFRETNSTSIQINIGNLLSEFLRLAFDQPNASDGDFSGPSLSATIERLLFSRHDQQQEVNREDEENKSGQDTSTTEEKLTPVVLAEHILSKSNLEQFFDALTQRPGLVGNGCDFLDNILDLLSRHMPAPVCLPLATSTAEENTSTNERMQINDEGGDAALVSKSTDHSQAFATLAKDPLVRIYSIVLEVIPSRLPALISLLASPSVPSTSSSTVKYPFINQPLGPLRLNLIKFFSKLIYTVSNDYTGDRIYQIFDSSRLFHHLIDLFDCYIYNNFLHTQVYLLVRLIVHINSIAVKQPNDIWTRTSRSERLDPSTFQYTHRCSYQLLQSILSPSGVNLFERLFRHYEQQMSAKKSDGESSSPPFTPPNTGHTALILRCLRDHAATFDNYGAFLQSKSSDSMEVDTDVNTLEKRWQAVLDHLNEDEKKWAAMHLHERHNTDTFRITSGIMAFGQKSTLNDSAEANRRREKFQSRYGTNDPPYLDDDDEDEAERLDIDDELMNNEQTSNERKVAEMKKISFEHQFPAVFDEQTLWHQQESNDASESSPMKAASAPALPDLFEQHRKQQEKSCTSTESNFEQLCSLRSADSPGGSVLFPFQSSSSSSTLRDEVVGTTDTFWQQHPIHLAKIQVGVKKLVSSSSSEEDSDEEEDNFFIRPNTETSTRLESTNMMDIFQRQPSLSSTTDALECNTAILPQQPIRSSTPERIRRTQAMPPTSIDEHDSDEDDELDLQDNFSLLIAKGMLKPKSS